MKPMLARAMDWLAWSAARLGWPGLLGLALMLGAVGVSQVLVRPMEQESAALADRARSLAQRRAAPVAAVAAVRDWRADLPADHEAYGRLTRLFRAAETAGLALNEGSYRTQFDGTAGLGRLVISLPVSGGYPAVRGFLAEALNRDPALALEHLRLSREAMDETELAADLRFALALGSRP